MRLQLLVGGPAGVGGTGDVVRLQLLVGGPADMYYKVLLVLSRDTRC